MEFLISLYDNTLIYHPNIFFSLLLSISFIVVFLGIKSVLSLITLIIHVGNKSKRSIGKTGSRAYFQIKTTLKHSRKSISPYGLVKSFIIAIIDGFFTIIGFIIIVISRSLLVINSFLNYSELKIEKTLRRIGKEILIDK